MSFTYNIEEGSGKVRLLATDTDEDNPLFDDDAIEAFLALEAGNVRRAAALALETVASSQALLLKKIEVSNLKTDGPAVAKELRDRAKALRDQATTDESRAGDTFGVAEMVTNHFSARERIINQWLRRQA